MYVVDFYFSHIALAGLWKGSHERESSLTVAIINAWECDCLGNYSPTSTSYGKAQRVGRNMNSQNKKQQYASESIIRSVVTEEFRLG